MSITRYSLSSIIWNNIAHYVRTSIIIHLYYSVFITLLLLSQTKGGRGNIRSDQKLERRNLVRTFKRMRNDCRRRRH